MTKTSMVEIGKSKKEKYICIQLSITVGI